MSSNSDFDEVQIVIARLDGDPYREAFVGVALDWGTVESIGRQVDSDRIECWAEKHSLDKRGGSLARDNKLHVVMRGDVGPQSLGSVWDSPTPLGVFLTREAASDFIESNEKPYGVELGVNIHIWSVDIGKIDPRVYVVPDV